jgi:hypothetical protein
MVIELAIVLIMIFVTVVATISIIVARHRLSIREADRKRKQTAIDIDRLQKELDQMDQEQNREAL